MEKITIKNIYAGKPDARDEIETEGMQSFINTFISPANIDVDSFFTGSCCFITGFKGTGKTGLLYYLNNLIHKKTPWSSSSFIFFKGDYSDAQKQELENKAKYLLTAISFSDNIALDGTDFEYIWKWLFYQRIVNDNIEYNFGIFKNDDNWNAFKKIISTLSGKEKNFLRIPPILKFSLPIDPQNPVAGEISLELDFKSNPNNTEAYRKFTELLDVANKYFHLLKRTDTPYYVFVDELEAYYGDDKVFYRDLRMIRDLIFTVKKINSEYKKLGWKDTKIICSVRTEIINAINRFITTKELNKVTSGFEYPLSWNYTNTNSYNHPILQILLKRIKIADKEKSEEILIKKWFPSLVSGTIPANYILNNSWLKPRDIVRLLISAQTSLCVTHTAFTQATFDTLQKKYSQESLNEIKEELKALYLASQIDEIINCLTGFRVVFSLEQLEKRIQDFYQSSILQKKLNSILQDLYRLGILGNYSNQSHLYRWQHRGDDGLIISNEWQFMIHRALHSALSLSFLHDNVMNGPQPGDIVEVKITGITPSHANCSVLFEERKYRGSIHKSQIVNEHVMNIHDYLEYGKTYDAKVLTFNIKDKKYQLTFLYDE